MDGDVMEQDRDPAEEIAARARLAELEPALPPGPWPRAEWRASNSNDVWRLDDRVLRVCWRGDRRRIEREVLIADALPPSLVHPLVLASGAHAGMTWQLMRYVPGRVLAETWLAMDEHHLRPLVAQLARLLRTLHEWTPPEPVRASLAERERPQPDPEAFNLLPLPVERAVPMLGRASQLPFVDPELVRAIETRLGELAPLDPFASDQPRAVVHGDAQPTNLIVADDRIAALLDYEWCRMAPIDTELAIWLHILRVVHVLAPAVSPPPVLRWLRDDYPALFAHPDLEGRLWLYAIVFGLRGLLVWPPDAPERELVAVHHVHALRELVDAPPVIPGLNA